MINLIISKIADILSNITPEGISPLSWFLVFMMLFAIFEIAINKTKLFAKKRYAGTLVSLIMAWFASSSPWLINVVSAVFPPIGSVMIVILILLIVIFTFHKEDFFSRNKDPIKNLVYFFAIVVLIIFALAALPNEVTSISILPFINVSSTDVTIIFLFCIVIFVLWYLNKE